ncbi:MAG TPA: hypothetical protein PLX35_07405 [Cyclobacteriaceae bacterium]|nr:hypothetical protein [Cyclobacteriaceae bacterium]
MKQKLFLFLLVIMLSCSEEKIQKKTLTQSDLNEFIQSQKTKKSLGSAGLTSEIISFVTKYDMRVVQIGSQEYQSAYDHLLKNSSFARTACQFEATLVTGIGGNYGCWVFIFEYGACGSNTGCVGNMWLCGGGVNWRETVIC